MVARVVGGRDTPSEHLAVLSDEREADARHPVLGGEQHALACNTEGRGLIGRDAQAHPTAPGTGRGAACACLQHRGAGSHRA